MAGPGDCQESGDPADRAGKHHRPDDDLFDVDRAVPRRVFTVTDDRDLKAVLRVLQINEDENGQRQHQDYVQPVGLVEDLREPADKYACTYAKQHSAGKACCIKRQANKENDPRIDMVCQSWGRTFRIIRSSITICS